MKKKHANFEHLGSDMFWSHFCHKKLSWHGLDNKEWWNSDKNSPVRECFCGKKYKLDHKTNEIEEVVP